MFVKEWSEKLTNHAKQQFMNSSFWIDAASHGLSWEEAVIDMPTVKAAVNRMDKASTAVLRAFYSCFGAGPVHEERLFSSGALRTDLSGAEFRYGLIQLQNAGILFALRKGWGERLYALPSDCFMIWHHILFPIDAEPSAINSGYGHWEQKQEESPNVLLGRQLLAAWAELGRSGLGLTTKGTLPKKTAAKVAQAIGLADSDLLQAGWQAEPEDPYAPVLSFVLKLSFQLGVLTCADGRLKWEEDALAAWMNQSEASREAHLLRWCLDELLTKARNAAALLIRLAPGVWYSELELERQLNRIGMETDEWGAQSNWASWLNLLRALGWIELAHTDSEKLLRWTIRPQDLLEKQQGKTSFEPILLEPNGDIIVLPGCHYSIRWELELIAERKSEDHISIWKLTRQSIGRALEYGRTISTIMTFLHMASGDAPLSPLLESSLADWGKQGAGQEALLVERFHSYPPMPLTAQSASEIVLKSPLQTLEHYELMNHEDFTIERFLPELDRVPLSWIQQLRSYHHSTRLEILEKALSWQTPVQLSIDESVVAFVPAKLERLEGGWTVTGILREDHSYREVCLTPEMWQGMKLVVPGASGFV
ncbi:helicase-associated domain-containing protein [Paenibacillus lupini]|uniref:helicase-associated domain-containing protein n=1 Tax=Paenibacillus lupini TaxID=1450204 RepID=UPI0014204AC7|nr:helicase-associated domain-containing protein [Paenibacillus lupini]NIK22603.1 hypothetical protein [Paenibacillus lupini]